MTVVLIFVLIFQAMTLAGILTLMEEKQQKAGRKQKTNVYRKMGELEARRILRDLANEMTTTAEETAAIDTALERQWCYLDGPCEYGNEEIEFSEAQLDDFIKNGQTHKRKESKEQKMAKSGFILEVKVSDNEIKQICKELGGRALTEENLDKYSRTWRRILERVREQITKAESKAESEDKECI